LRPGVPASSTCLALAPDGGWGRRGLHRLNMDYRPPGKMLQKTGQGTDQARGPRPPPRLGRRGLQAEQVSLVPGAGTFTRYEPHQTVLYTSMRSAMPKPNAMMARFRPAFRATFRPGSSREPALALLLPLGRDRTIGRGPVGAHQRHRHAPVDDDRRTDGRTGSATCCSTRMETSQPYHYTVEP
jgi:hypothetical protein